MFSATCFLNLFFEFISTSRVPKEHVNLIEKLLYFLKVIKINNCGSFVAGVESPV